MNARENLDFAIQSTDSTAKSARNAANQVEWARKTGGVSDFQGERLAMAAKQLMALSDMGREIAKTLAEIDGELREATAPEATPGG